MIVTDLYKKTFGINYDSLANVKTKNNSLNRIEMAEVKIKPIGSRVLVEPTVTEDKTASGIIIPDSAKEKQQSGFVLAVGKGSDDNPMEVKVGDKVIYGKFSGTEIQHEGNDYLILEQSDILAVI